ncbi:endonuclease [Chlamydia suis]|uniref:Endonuclease n=1 Tax=Chlamydia suis TaxID=83559 RepID=A0AAQ0ESB6_9CHLA|nr:endonuclease [Chlamydia suis]QYC73085.1 endonuclease [Chlamydia suis]QYC73983.1 endonuclease [Chlamydia suis]QYC74893.1 endonuclease [Chlamydia suis]QYC75809.1 endonuclease [Chlamydia suis]
MEDMNAAQERSIATRNELLKEQEAIVGRLERLLGKKNTKESVEVLL